MRSPCHLHTKSFISRVELGRIPSTLYYNIYGAKFKLYSKKNIYFLSDKTTLYLDLSSATYIRGQKKEKQFLYDPIGV